MSELQAISDATIIKSLIVCIGGCLGIINALGLYVFKRLKKNIDDLWTGQNRDNDRITIIETRCKIQHDN